MAITVKCEINITIKSVNYIYYYIAIGDLSRNIKQIIGEINSGVATGEWVG